VSFSARAKKGLRQRREPGQRKAELLQSTIGKLQMELEVAFKKSHSCSWDAVRLRKMARSRPEQITIAVMRVLRLPSQLY